MSKRNQRTITPFDNTKRSAEKPEKGITMLSLILVVFLGIVALGMLGVAIFEAVGHARGAPSPRLNFMRPLVGPLAIAILAAWAAWRTYKQRQIACGKRTS